MMIRIIARCGRAALPSAPTPDHIIAANSFNKNGAVDVDDLLAVINGWGPC
jgi:hypothetical protein